MIGNHNNINSVKTNVITGFLGTGKTTAISHLLTQKPAHERWAILVNEFGEIGIDGAILNAKSQAMNGVYIEEVPGGCMCCASKLPMQIALNNLLKKARPHRLLIEPTGLGHPKEVMQVLGNQYYKNVLQLNNTITLVDARYLDDPRYLSHETFNQQLAVADVVVGNKSELYQEIDRQALSNYLNEFLPEHRQLHFSEQGKIQLAWLENRAKQIDETHSSEHLNSLTETEELKIPEIGYVRAINRAKDFSSIGWRFSANKVFEYGKLMPSLKQIKADRIKGIFITNKGIFAINRTSNDFFEQRVTTAKESRIEIICDDIDNNWEKQLMQALFS